VSKIFVYRRPTVIFDPDDRNHRLWLVNFMRTGSWRGCPVTFASREELGGNLIGDLQHQLLLWYGARERVRIKA
jgi:hypothetical protein